MGENGTRLLFSCMTLLVAACLVMSIVSIAAALIFYR